MLDLLMQNGFVGDRDSETKSQGQGGQGGTRHVKRFTWRHCWVVHVDFSGVLDKVSTVERSFGKKDTGFSSSAFGASHSERVV
jgi:hypothetical protein